MQSDDKLCYTNPMPYIIGWANNHFNNLHFNKSLETQNTRLKWEWDNHLMLVVTFETYVVEIVV